MKISCFPIPAEGAQCDLANSSSVSLDIEALSESRIANREVLTRIFAEALTFILLAAIVLLLSSPVLGAFWIEHDGNRGERKGEVQTQGLTTVSDKMSWQD